jgi:hypothetical protein
MDNVVPFPHLGGHWKPSRAPSKPPKLKPAAARSKQSPRHRKKPQPIGIARRSRTCRRSGANAGGTLDRDRRCGGGRRQHQGRRARRGAPLRRAGRSTPARSDAGNAIGCEALDYRHGGERRRHQARRTRRGVLGSVIGHYRSLCPARAGPPRPSPWQVPTSPIVGPKSLRDARQDCDGVRPAGRKWLELNRSPVPGAQPR